MADTIYALASGRPPSGVAVVRISGSKARFALETIGGPLPEPRRLALRAMRAATGEDLDRGLVAWLPGPATFTGEDCAELHCHGGPAVVSAVLDRLGEIGGLRLAEAGEFTRRAFVNGRIELTEAEALADLVNAETQAQRRFALAAAGGAQRKVYAGWRERLIQARALVEAALDFSDEGDVPAGVTDPAWAETAQIRDEILRHLDGFRAAEIIRDGFRVVIAGPPNAGKSSLLNALARREVALVSPVPGTTRDVLDVALSVDGHLVIVSDTAGLRSTDDPVEAMGVSRAEERLASADLVLMLRPADDLDAPSAWTGPGLDVVSKSDLILPGASPPPASLSLSSRTGEGLDGLLAAIGQEVRSRTDTTSALPARERHAQLLRQTTIALEGAGNPQLPIELRAEELRQAAQALGRINGAVDVEDLLDVIFSRFCVGK